MFFEQFIWKHVLSQMLSHLEHQTAEWTVDHLLTLTVNFLSNHRAGSSTSFAATSASKVAPFTWLRKPFFTSRSMFLRTSAFNFSMPSSSVKPKILRIQHQLLEVLFFNKFHSDFELSWFYQQGFQLGNLQGKTSITFSSPFFIPTMPSSKPGIIRPEPKTSLKSSAEPPFKLFTVYWTFKVESYLHVFLAMPFVSAQEARCFEGFRSFDQHLCRLLQMLYVQLLNHQISR